MGCVTPKLLHQMLRVRQICFLLQSYHQDTIEPLPPLKTSRASEAPCSLPLLPSPASSAAALNWRASEPFKARKASQPASREGGGGQTAAGLTLVAAKRNDVIESRRRRRRRKQHPPSEALMGVYYTLPLPLPLSLPLSASSSLSLSLSLSSFAVFMCTSNFFTPGVPHPPF